MDEIIIKAKLLYKDALLNPKYNHILNQFKNEYFENINCNHDQFLDQGYYKTHNGDIYVSTREESQFRYIKCSTCGENIFLFRTLDENWDTAYKNNQIKIKKISKTKIKL